MQLRPPRPGRGELLNPVRFGANDFLLEGTRPPVHVVVLDLDRILPSAWQEVHEMTLSGLQLTDAVRTEEVKSGRFYKRTVIACVTGLLATGSLFSVLAEGAVGGVRSLLSILMWGCVVLVGVVAYSVLMSWRPRVFSAVEILSRPSGAVGQTVLLSEVVSRPDDIFQYWDRIDRGWKAVRGVRALVPGVELREVLRLGYESQAELAMLARAAHTRVPELGEHRERTQMAVDAFEAKVDATLTQAKHHAEAVRLREQRVADTRAEERRLQEQRKAAEATTLVSLELSELRRHRPTAPPESEREAGSEPHAIAAEPEPADGSWRVYEPPTVET